MSEHQPHLRPASALEIIILTDFTFKVHWVQRELTAALQIYDRLTEQEREFFAGMRAEINQGLAADLQLDESEAGFACVYQLGVLVSFNQPVPQDPVATFREKVKMDRLRYFPSSRLIKAIGLCRRWPDQYYGAIQREAARLGLVQDAPPLAGPRMPIIRYLTSVVAMMGEPQYGLKKSGAYSDLNEGEAGVLLGMCIELHRAGELKDEYMFLKAPAWMAAQCPEVLAKHHGLLLDAKLPVEGPVFRVATAEIRDRLLREAAGHAIWIGDDVVRKAMRDRRHAVSKGVGSEHYYGWELRADGGRRDLHTQECYYLSSKEKPWRPVVADVMRVVVDHEGTCPECDRKLVSVFDINLEDPRMAFLARGEDGKPAGAAPKRLRIAACEQCVDGAYQPSGMIFTRVDLQGKSEVMANPWGLPAGRRKVAVDPQEALSRDSLAIEPVPCSPVALVCEVMLGSGSSAIGGLPHWEQNAEYPKCPECKRRMPFVGQVDAGSLKSGSGVMYAHLCRKCWIATVVHQID